MNWTLVTLWLAAVLLLAAAASSATAALTKSKDRKRPLSLLSAGLALAGLVLIVVSQLFPD
jgi:cytochrome bd-type quinol oxidase subunit 2